MGACLLITIPFDQGRYNQRKPMNSKIHNSQRKETLNCLPKSQSLLTPAAMISW